MKVRPTFEEWFADYVTRFGTGDGSSRSIGEYDYRAAYEAGHDPAEDGSFPDEFRAVVLVPPPSVPDPSVFIGFLDAMLGSKVPDSEDLDDMEDDVQPRYVMRIQHAGGTDHDEEVSG